MMHCQGIAIHEVSACMVWLLQGQNMQTDTVLVATVLWNFKVFHSHEEVQNS